MEYTPGEVRDAMIHLGAALVGAPTVSPPPGAGLNWWRTEIEGAILSCESERFTALAVNAAIAGLGEAQLRVWYDRAMEAAPARVRHYWMGPCNDPDCCGSTSN
jgi:hypothetical protein